MKYLFAAATALAVLLTAPALHAQARSGALKNAAARTTTPALETYQRDHRIPYVGPGGGVKVRRYCPPTSRGCRASHSH
jgi:hypothetical protein